MKTTFCNISFLLVLTILIVLTWVSCKETGVPVEDNKINYLTVSGAMNSTFSTKCGYGLIFFNDAIKEQKYFTFFVRPNNDINNKQLGLRIFKSNLVMPPVGTYHLIDMNLGSEIPEGYFAADFVPFDSSDAKGKYIVQNGTITISKFSNDCYYGSYSMVAEFRDSTTFYPMDTVHLSGEFYSTKTNSISITDTVFYLSFLRNSELWAAEYSYPPTLINDTLIFNGFKTIGGKNERLEFHITSPVENTNIDLQQIGEKSFAIYSYFDYKEIFFVSDSGKIHFSKLTSSFIEGTFYFYSHDSVNKIVSFDEGKFRIPF